ncbi:FAD-dependent oxidoreductase [Spirochaetia bacterium]|nr:FAD-dependent oxidoreductase [Spirochaetia bacterium]
MNCDVLIVGAGPAGIFTALELIRRGSPVGGPGGGAGLRKQKKIVIMEKGSPIEKRSCPKIHTKKCMNCKPYCHITTGFSGAGAFSDGKLSLSCEVGGDFPDLIGRPAAQELINYTDRIYLEFGAVKEVEGIGNDDNIKDIRRRAIKAGLKLVDCPIRHLGTEKAQELYRNIQGYLIEKGVEFLFDTECTNLILGTSRLQSSVEPLVRGSPLENSVCKGVRAHDVGKAEHFDVFAPVTIVAAGRRGADWLDHICREHDVVHESGTVDIGVRVEMRNEIMEEVNNALYESKLVGYPKPFKDKVRTFCQNPGGFVSQENYDNNLAVVNGHSYKEMKSRNTNLAILSSHNFSDPFNQPIAYAQKIGELTNMLANGHILVQRYGDILDGKRTWQDELERSSVQPTLSDAVAGDITSAMPYRAMTNIINFIEALDMVVPGFASAETLLYSPELKFYSNRIKLNSSLETNIPGLHCLGDSSGWTRGLMMASAMGVLMGRVLG